MNSVFLSNAEIKKALLGQSVDVYDSWDGSSVKIMVSSVKFSKGFVVLKENKKTVSVPKESVEELIKRGKVTSVSEIDHCTITKIFSLIKNPDLQTEIDGIVKSITELKKVLKTLRKNQINNIASSTFLEHIRGNVTNTNC